MNRKAYTLMELLVVIGIIVLILLMAIPAFNIISGNRSIDAAQNQLQAIIGRARQEAMGLQDYRGVVVFTDPNTGRLAAVEVYYPDPTHPTLLGAVPGHDEVLLPKGIGALSLQDQGAVGGLPVLMFDRQGQFVSRPWSVAVGGTTQFSTQTPPTDPIQRLAWRVQPFPASADNSHLPVPAADTSAFGAILFTDPGAFGVALQASGGQIVLPGPQQPDTAGSPAGRYLADNGTWYMVNRYGGTLLRAE